MGRRNKDEEADRNTQASEENQNTAENTAENQDLEAEETITQELSLEEQLEVKLTELNDKYLRLYSDFENFRKRTIKEKGDLIMNASEGIVKDMVPILDDFERAISNNETSEIGRASCRERV